VEETEDAIIREKYEQKSSKKRTEAIGQRNSGKVGR